MAIMLHGMGLELMHKHLKPLLAAMWCIALLFSTQAAFAHPHVWVTARSQLVFEANKLTAIRHSWTFDPAYSKYAIQGLATNPDGTINAEELADLARLNVENLHEFDYFTKAKANGKALAFTNPIEPSITLKDDALTLHFTLPVDLPAQANRTLALEVYDPTYFVSFVFAPEQDAVNVVGTPSKCAVTITRPKQQNFNEQEELSEAFFNALTTASSFGQDFATRAIVACP